MSNLRLVFSPQQVEDIRAHCLQVTIRPPNPDEQETVESLYGQEGDIVPFYSLAAPDEVAGYLEIGHVHSGTYEELACALQAAALPAGERVLWGSNLERVRESLTAHKQSWGDLAHPATRKRADKEFPQCGYGVRDAFRAQWDTFYGFKGSPPVPERHVELTDSTPVITTIFEYVDLDFVQNYLVDMWSKVDAAADVAWEAGLPVTRTRVFLDSKHDTLDMLVGRIHSPMGSITFGLNRCYATLTLPQDRRRFGESADNHYAGEVLYWDGTVDTLCEMVGTFASELYEGQKKIARYMQEKFLNDST